MTTHPKPQGVPETAEFRHLNAGRYQGDYWIWQVKNQWYWQTWSDCGEEETERDAAIAARRQIKGE